jgi:hypothetical protein
VTERFDDLQQPSGEPFPLPEIDSNGVDRSQIRRQLALTPSERLQVLETFLASVIQLRRGIRKSAISQDSSSAR